MWDCIIFFFFVVGWLGCAVEVLVLLWFPAFVGDLGLVLFYFGLFFSSYVLVCSMKF